MKSIFVAILFASTMVTAAFGQSRDPIQAAKAAPAVRVASAPANASVSGASSACAFTFTAPATAKAQYVQFCVTSNGNIVEFQSPEGDEHIRVGTYNEGYAICDVTGGWIGYHDYADGGDSDSGSGWKAPVLLSQTATSVKIARTTLDGVWTLTQTFTLAPGDASAKIVMALKNNSATAREIWLTRVVDIDADNSTDDDVADGTRNTVFGYNVGGGGQYGLQLSLAAANPFIHYGWASTWVNDACSVGNGYSGDLLHNADAVGYLYHWMIVPARATRTVKLKYKGM